MAEERAGGAGRYLLNTVYYLGVLAALTPVMLLLPDGLFVEFILLAVVLALQLGLWLTRGRR